LFAIFRIWVDRIAAKVSSLFAWFSVFVLGIILAGLIWKSLPIMRSHGFSDLLFSSEWKPLQKQFGFLPFIVSTLYVTITALVLAIPACILASLYLVEYASRKLTNAVLPIIGILAGIPSVIYGIWGLLMVVPFVRNYVAPFFHVESTGYSILAGGMVLAVMVFPLMINLLVEVLRAVPRELREASLSLGTTRWETSLFVVLRQALPGIFAAVILAFARAFGETIAVLMVVGNVVKIPAGVFDSGYPIPALIANNYGEMLSIPSYDSALMFAALILLVIILLFNLFSSLVLKKLNIQVH
jgi:phosphate transport system permease protein